MNKKLILLPLILTMLATSCTPTTSSEPNPMDDGIIMMNDFEDLSQLSLMKFPFPKHSDRGRFDIVSEHVTSGNKALKYSNDHGNYVEVCHYFTHLAEPGIDKSDIKSIELDIYNDSEWDSSCTLLIYATEEMTTLLTENFELKKGETTHISFNLSKVALDFNHETMICSSLKLYTINTDYNKGKGYTFYIDNWHAKMGAEYTELDLEYKPTIDALREKIDTLPRGINITTEHETILKDIAVSLSHLPDLYRRAVPNIAKYNEALEGYYNYICATTSIDLDRNTFLQTDSFYGSVQLYPENDTRADVFYSEEIWPGESEPTPSTRINFAGNTDNKFVYNTEVNLNDFDFIHFRIWNASSNYVRIWLSYPSNVYLDLKAGEVKVATFSARLLANQFSWAILHLRSQTDGTLINSSGSVIFDEVYVTGRSPETRKAQLLDALDKLPDINALITEDDYIKAITMVKTARELYGDLLDKDGIDLDKIEALYAIEEKIDNAGYGICYNTYKDTMKRFDYGEDFSATATIANDEFGFVSAAHITGCPPHVNFPETHEQAFTFSNATNLEGEYGGFVIYIYNPTEDIYAVSVKDTSWKWVETAPYQTNMDLVPGWNKVEIKTELIMASDDRKVVFLANDKNLNNDFAGDWLFSSLVGVPRKI